MLYRRHRRVILLVATLGVILLIYIIHQSANDKERSETEYDIKRFEHPTEGCGGHFKGYGHLFVTLHNAVFLGNETFSIPCQENVPNYSFIYDEESPLGSWVERLQTHSVSQTPHLLIKTMPTFVFKRIEAHNYYHTLCEWFNVFMVSKILGFDARNADILLLDDRPDSPLDETWDILFNDVTRYRKLPEKVAFKTLILGIVGYNSPLNFHFLHKLPFADEFHDFFVKAFNVEKPKKLECSKLKVTVIWRRDYMTHPERKNLTNGLVHRKFKNEDEIHYEIKTAFDKASIQTIILEQMSMQEQLNVITQTDVLIGMHGAGMAHAFFLPKHAVVIEFFPNYWGFLRHYGMFSKWRGVKYIGWQNKDDRNEFPDFYTRIPPHIVKEHALKAKDMVC